MDEPSRAILVPANRFEVMECRAALDANYLGAQDTPPLIDGALDVLAQHVLGMACAEPFNADQLYREVQSAAPYSNLSRETFDQILDFVATGGYALKTYERFAKIRKTVDGTWRVSNPRIAQQYRLNIGTIVEAPELNVRLTRGGKGANARAVGRGGRVLGRIEEYFLETLTPGDTFLFAGKVLRFEGIRENECIASNAADRTLKYRFMLAVNSRFPPISHRRYARCWQIVRAGRFCRNRCANGWKCRHSSRSCRVKTSC